MFVYFWQFLHPGLPSGSTSMHSRYTFLKPWGVQRWCQILAVFVYVLYLVSWPEKNFHQTQKHQVIGGGSMNNTVRYNICGEKGEMLTSKTRPQGQFLSAFGCLAAVRATSTLKLNDYPSHKSKPEEYVSFFLVQTPKIAGVVFLLVALP